jgi:hypothetical protein
VFRREAGSLEARNEDRIEALLVNQLPDGEARLDKSCVLH